mgnify:CR=1 FL=1
MLPGQIVEGATDAKDAIRRLAMSRGGDNAFVRPIVSSLLLSFLLLPLSEGVHGWMNGTDVK